MELTTQWYAEALAANPKATAEDFARLYRCRPAGKFVQDPAGARQREVTGASVMDEGATRLI